MDKAAADQLKLYIDNDGDLHRQQTTSILKNLMTRRARGEYDVDKAVVLWGYLVESGAKKYAKEHSPTVPWHVLFPVPLRREVARALARDFESEAGYGNYDHLLPKKYQQARASVAAPALTRARPPKRAAQARSGRELDRDIAEAVTRSTRVALARRARRH